MIVAGDRNKRSLQAAYRLGILTNAPQRPEASVLLCGTGVDPCDLAPDGFDCNENGVHDACDIARGSSADGDRNGVPDECRAGGQVPGDGNQDGRVDIADAIWMLGYLFSGTGQNRYATRL